MDTCISLRSKEGVGVGAVVRVNLYAQWRHVSQKSRIQEENGKAFVSVEAFKKKEGKLQYKTLVTVYAKRCQNASRMSAK